MKEHTDFFHDLFNEKLPIVRNEELLLQNGQTRRTTLLF